MKGNQTSNSHGSVVTANTRTREQLSLRHKDVQQYIYTGNFTESERVLTGCPVRTLLPVRAARSALRAAHVRVYPSAAARHVVLHLAVTACKCSEQAVSTEAGANMKNPSKTVLLQCERRLLLVFFFFFLPGQNPFFFFFFFFFFFLHWPVSCHGFLAESQPPGQEQRGWTVSLRAEVRTFECDDLR